MKKALFIILSVVLAFAVFSADGKDDLPECEATPDDVWDGDYAKFGNKDGSSTYVFDNGSVLTVKPDGTKEGYDYLGNKHSLDSDGNYTVAGRDGYTATEMADGTRKLKDPTGVTTVMRTDGSFSEEMSLGIVFDYDAEGRPTGVGFTGDSQRIGADGDGYYKDGEISTPDGRLLQINGDKVTILDRNGTKVNIDDSGNKESITVDWKDGSHCESCTTSAWDNGQKTENREIYFKDPDGNVWESDSSITYDREGNPYWSGNNVAQYTTTDGERYWVDNNSKAMEYYGKNGDRMILDRNGNLTDFKDEYNEWLVRYDSEGRAASGNMTFADGTTVVITDGTTTLTRPDGTVFETDRQGNVFKDGVQIKENGEWLPGMEEKYGDGKPAQSGNVDWDEVLGPDHEAYEEQLLREIEAAKAEADKAIRELRELTEKGSK